MPGARWSERLARPLLLLVSVTIAGCAASGPQLAQIAAPEPAHVELDATPFFPQRDYQCGPAALATLLVASGLDTSADALVAEVYLPGREGSLQTELVAATRRAGRQPYLLPTDVRAMFGEVAGGRPVVVLQKLGAGPWPGWHYAVLIGYDTTTNRVILRSGTTRRLEMSAKKFLWSWDRAGRWSLLALEPGELPAQPDYTRFMEGAAGLEAVGRTHDAEAAYRAAVARWPDSALPYLGLANLAYARGDLAEAARGYRAAMARDAVDAAARYNLAETLVKAGCPARALGVLEEARRLAGDGAYAQTIAEALARHGRGATSDRSECMAW
jgi:hypothetical protein